MSRAHPHADERRPANLGTAGLPMFDAETAPLCDRCEASFRAPDDTLCSECRAEVDAAFFDLPGAVP